MCVYDFYFYRFMAQNDSYLPFILAVFADNGLEEVAVEVKKLRKTFVGNESKKLYTFDCVENLTHDRLKDSFNDARRATLTIFHYAGHAVKESLALSDKPFKGSELGEILKSCKELKIVFLNACCTKKLVFDLLQSGIKAVIATKEKVEDKAASLLGEKFYHNLINGIDIRNSFRIACEFNGENDAESKVYRGLTYKGDKKEEGENVRWGIYVNPNLSEEEYKKIFIWSLRDGIGILKSIDSFEKNRCDRQEQLSDFQINYERGQTAYCLFGNKKACHDSLLKRLKLYVKNRESSKLEEKNITYKCFNYEMPHDSEDDKDLRLLFLLKLKEICDISAGELGNKNNQNRFKNDFWTDLGNKGINLVFFEFEVELYMVRDMQLLLNLFLWVKKSFVASQSGVKVLYFFKVYVNNRAKDWLSDLKRRFWGAEKRLKKSFRNHVHFLPRLSRVCVEDLKKLIKKYREDEVENILNKYFAGCENDNARLHMEIVVKGLNKWIKEEKKKAGLQCG